MTATNTSLRERNKTKRREAILDATLELLRHEPLTAVTTERIAERAEVSAMTVYNLVGTREALLIALVDRVIDDLVNELARRLEEGTRDPIADARMIIEVSIAAFVADSSAYRQIMGSLRELAAAGTRMEVDPAQLQVVAVREAQRQGIVGEAFDASAIGKQIYLGYLGAVMAWVGGILDDAGFLTAALHGLYVCLVSVATDEWRPTLTEELLALGSTLEASGWGAG
jgi:AcrR family transcriptional regulator